MLATQNSEIAFAFKVQVLYHNITHKELSKDIKMNWDESVIWRETPYDACEFFISSQRFENYEFPGEIKITRETEMKSDFNQKVDVFNSSETFDTAYALALTHDPEKWLITIDDVGKINLAVVVDRDHSIPFKAANLRNRHINKNLVGH